MVVDLDVINVSGDPRGEDEEHDDRWAGDFFRQEPFNISFFYTVRIFCILFSCIATLFITSSEKVEEVLYPFS